MSQQQTRNVAQENIGFLRARDRSARGSGIVEGVVGLALVIAGGIGVTLLIADVGLAVFGKIKLASVTAQTANYVTTLPAEQQEDAGKAYAEDLMKAMGLGAGNPKVIVKPTTIQGQQAISVTVKADCKLLVSGFNYLPIQVRLKDTAVATSVASSDNHTVGYLIVRASGGNPGYLGVPGRDARTMALPIVKPKDGKLMYVLEDRGTATAFRVSASNRRDMTGRYNPGEPFLE